MPLPIPDLSTHKRALPMSELSTPIFSMPMKNMTRTLWMKARDAHTLPAVSMHEAR